jgi:hypothetical protein
VAAVGLTDQSSSDTHAIVTCYSAARLAGTGRSADRDAAKQGGVTAIADPTAGATLSSSSWQSTETTPLQPVPAGGCCLTTAGFTFAVGLFAYGVFCVAQAKHGKAC